MRVLCAVLSVGLLACDDDPPAAALDGLPPDVAVDPTVDAAGDAEPDAAPFTVVTFNTGSGPEANHDAPPDDGYGQAEADLTDAWYGNGLAWIPLIDDTRAFFTDLQPDLVAFQEIFHPADCPDIPAEAHAGFVCEGWQPGDPTVVQQVLGDGYQVACHPGRTDKCLAVHARLGRIEGCAADLCLDGLVGTPVDGCGSGARVARGVIERTDGARLVVVSVHGTSGFSAEEQACRVARIEQIFVGPDALAAAPDDVPVIVLGDFNTDPGRVATIDESAARWLDFVGPDHPFRWISPMGPDAPGSYGGVFDIDHVVARGLTGACWSPGLDDRPPVTETVFFDHRPIVCEVMP